MSSINNKKLMRRGSWTKEECQLLVEAVQLFGKNWMKMSTVIKTRSSIQIRSHTQKLVLNICKKLHMNSITIKDYSLENYIINNPRCKYLINQSEMMILETFKRYIPWERLKLIKLKKQRKTIARYENEGLSIDNVISFNIDFCESTKKSSLNIFEQCSNSYLEIIHNIEVIESLLKGKSNDH